MKDLKSVATALHIKIEVDTMQVGIAEVTINIIGDPLKGLGKKIVCKISSLDDE